jgi:hypothetical protein
MSKKSKSTTTNEPSAFAKGYITPAANALSDTYNRNQGQAQGAADDLYDRLPGVMDQAFGTSPLLGAASNYATDVLGGKYLGQGNPYLNQMIDQTGNDVSDRVNALFSKSGRTGSTTHARDLTEGLANSENSLRYQDYGNERNAMGQAMGAAPGLESAKYTGYAPLLAMMQGAAGLPYVGAGNYASGIGSLVGNYNNQTQTSSPSPFSSIMDTLGKGAQIASLFSDRRLKRAIRKIGAFADGLGIYSWRYVWGEEATGVMADEVADLRPWALGPEIDGFATVNYGAL